MKRKAGRKNFHLILRLFGLTVIVSGCLLPWILESKLTKFVAISTTATPNSIDDVKHHHHSPHQIVSTAGKRKKLHPSFPGDVPNVHESAMANRGKDSVNHGNKPGDDKSRQPLILPDNTSFNNATKNNNDLILHFIVSSGCSEYQQWEVLAQIHSARKLHQSGRYTWILSGCLPEEDSKIVVKEQRGQKDKNTLRPSQILEVVQHHFPSNLASDLITPNVHFTPDYSDMSVYGGPYADGKLKRSFVGRNGKPQYGNFGNHYHFNNKPNGLLHWAKEYYGGKNQERLQENEAIVLIDPDFLFLKLFHFGDSDKEQRPRPKHPMAAKYGLGGQWLDFNRIAICGVNSQCTKVVNEDINKHYSVGPPYIIHAQDVLPLVEQWSKFVPPTYDQYPLLYAEMYAYSMAAAHLNLPHTSLHNIFMGCMIGWPQNNKKQKLDGNTPELSAKVFRENAGADIFNPNVDDGPASCFLPELTIIPPFIHYCHRYAIDTSTIPAIQQQPQSNITSKFLFFAKRRVPQTVLECKEPNLILFESDNDQERIDHVDWTTLTACAVIRAVNYARKQHCVKS